jgi:hypothetical protein
MPQTDGLGAAYGRMIAGAVPVLMVACALAAVLGREGPMDAAAWGRALVVAPVAIGAAFAALLYGVSRDELRRIAAAARNRGRSATVSGGVLALAAVVGALLAYNMGCAVTGMLGWERRVCSLLAWIGGVAAGAIAAAALARRAR